MNDAATDMHALVKEVERNQRRKRMEREYGPIRISHVFPPIPIRNFDYHAYFYNLCDLDMPNWARASGATEAEALDELLTQAEEHHAEQLEDKRLAELERQSGCSDV